MGSAENEYIEGFYLVEVTEEESSDPSSTWYDSEPGFYLESLENNINNTRLVIEIGEENYNPDGYYLYCFD